MYIYSNKYFFSFFISIYRISFVISYPNFGVIFFTMHEHNFLNVIICLSTKIHTVFGVLYAVGNKQSTWISIINGKEIVSERLVKHKIN